MPGVVISTAVRVGPSTATVRASSQLFCVGLTQRGPSDEAVMVESLEEFEKYFGGYQSYSYVHPTIQTFFEEGGTRAYIARAVGAAADLGSLTLDDGDGDPTITITAVGPGAWSEDVSVIVTAGTSGKIIRVFYDGDLLVNTGDQTTVAGLINTINNSSLASAYVVATNENSTNVDPLPDTLASTDLSAGDDDRSAADDSVNGIYHAGYKIALDLFGDALGAGAVACPELSTLNMQNHLVAHANTNNRIAILHSASGSDKDDAIDDAAAITSGDNAEHAAYYFPWVYVPTGTTGVNRLIPPDGYVAAKRAVAHNQTGPHQPAAGLISKASYVNGVEVAVDKTDGDELDDGRVNAIRVIQNSVRVYGARSCSDDTTNFRFYTGQDVLNSIVVDAYATLEDLVFGVIDGRNILFTEIEARLINVLTGMRNIGALYEAYDVNGRRLDPGFTVRCDRGLNPVSQLANGTIAAQVGVRVSSVGDKIEVTIIKSNLTTSVV
jgi:phage tail sheath protein FI